MPSATCVVYTLQFPHPFKDGFKGTIVIPKQQTKKQHILNKYIFRITKTNFLILSMSDHADFLAIIANTTYTTFGRNWNADILTISNKKPINN